jgi:hypothetical protein
MTMDRAMLDEVLLFEDDFELENELPPDQLHRTDDPSVWGLLDVATGRHSEVPQTIYKTSGDSASGVVGIRYANGLFVSAAPSRVGATVVAGEYFMVRPVKGEPFREYEVAWDGAARSAPFINEETHEPGQEHSRGILLGEYPNKPEEQKLAHRGAQLRRAA